VKPIVKMSAAEICEAIKAEGERLGVKVATWSFPDASLFPGMTLVPDHGGHLVCVWMSWEFYGTDYTLDELRAGLRRWVSVRVEG
jgi:hypothetical protein